MLRRIDPLALAVGAVVTLFAVVIAVLHVALFA
jgi:hypothetical protein